MTIYPWPLVDRDYVVQTAKPETRSVSDNTVRLLRRKHVLSNGAIVSPRKGGRADGKISFFSRLNVVAARLFRAGKHEEARDVMALATEIEQGELFEAVVKDLSGFSRVQIEAVVRGDLPDPMSRGFLDSLAKLAEFTEIRVNAHFAIGTHSGANPLAGSDVVRGIVRELNDGYATIQVGSDTVLVPVRILSGINRDFLDSAVVVTTDMLDKRRAIVEAEPGFSVVEADDVEYSPFNRNDPRNRTFTDEDVALLSTQPSPLKVMYPVTINA